MKSFLKPFVDTLQSLASKGVQWYDKETKETRTSKVICPISTCDAPARAEVQNLQHFNGEYGCFCCEHQGESAKIGKGHNTVFLYPTNEDGEIIDPVEQVEYRTAERMSNQARQCFDEKLQHVYGVKGPSIVSLMPHFDIACGFVPDYVHIYLLGVF